MLFFESKSGRLFPVAEIESIIPSRLFEVRDGEKRPASAALLRDGTRVEIYCATVAELHNAGRSMVPAQPSTYLLGWWPEPGHETFISKDVVLAWRLTADGVAPVTTDSAIDSTSTNHAILHSDGTVSDLHGQNWGDRSEWEAEMKQRAEGG